MGTKNILVHFDFITMVNMGLLILLHTHSQNYHILQACSTSILLGSLTFAFRGSRAFLFWGFPFRIGLLHNCHWSVLVNKGQQCELCMRLVCLPLPLQSQVWDLCCYKLYMFFTFLLALHLTFTFTLHLLLRLLQLQTAPQYHFYCYGF